jgi:actin cytoskeleton-regulatory complex protein SLA1
MGFVAICTALYDYQPQGAGELEIRENDLLYILEKSSDDDWWKARKRADREDEDEPEGLIPFNYVEEARPSHAARALYDYSRQTDEEVSFTEDAVLDVYDTSDDDWTLVGVNGEYGFAPANYIELGAPAAPKSPSIASARQSMVSPPPAPAEPPAPASPVSPHVSSPAANLAAALTGRAPPSRSIPSPPVPQQEPTPEPSDSEEVRPPLPGRPQSQSIPSPVHIPQSSYQEEAPGVLPSPPYNRAGSRSASEAQPYSPGGYHLYNINEMVSAMGRRKKMPTTLGLNIATGTIMLSPEKSRDGPSQEWSADKLTHYSIEGKHVFMELVRPSKSLDLHAGAKDTAEEIVSALGEIAGQARGEGLKEVIAAATGGSAQKKGKVLYDFMAQGDDEVTVAVDDEIIILDDTKSEDWWNVRRLKNGKEGVMPSSYIEIIGSVAIEPSSRSGTNAGRSRVEQNRLEEERLAREAARADRARREAEEARARSEIPERGSSLVEDDNRKSKKDKRSNRSDGKSRSKPDLSKIRTWTDHSGSFKVEAQFIGIADGKIHLHKVNGVKIAVPVSKMSPEDLAYVEKVTKESIEDNMPVADLIKMKRKSQGPSAGQSGASIQLKQSDYDWFDFFLKAGVNPHMCERYSQSMNRDSMDESVLPDVTHDTLRTLGFKEGDSLKVMKYLNEKFNRNKQGSTNGDGGLFSGPGGALKDNSGRSRPEANRQVSDKVDEAAFKPQVEKKSPSEAQETPLAKGPAREPKDGFDDDAWTVKPSQKPTSPTPPAPIASPPPRAPSAAMADLSLLDKPLEPTRPEPKPQEQPPAPQAAPSAPAPPQQPQQTGATPSFFAQVGQQASGGRQRPAPPPQQSFTGSALLPPPQRPLSAPQNAQEGFGLQPLQPQLTGFATRQAPYGQSLEELNAQRLQQQQMQQMQMQMQLQPQQTGFPGQNFGQFNAGLAPQPTGFQMQQPYMNGNAAGSPFADPNPKPQFSMQPQQTGFPNVQTQMRPQTGINSVLPPSLVPQQTGYNAQQNGMNQFQSPIQQQQPQMQPQMTGFQQQMQPQPTGFGQPNGFQQSFSPPPVPPMPQSTTPAPLVPQKTGPAPEIRFGAPKKIAPQPTGRRANLSAASKLILPFM